MVTILDPHSTVVQATFVRLHCRAMAAGMTHSKMSKTVVLQKASEITGVQYKRGEHGKAAEDLTKFIEESKK